MKGEEYLLAIWGFRFLGGITKDAEEARRLADNRKKEAVRNQQKAINENKKAETKSENYEKAERILNSSLSNEPPKE